MANLPPCRILDTMSPATSHRAPRASRTKTFLIIGFVVAALAALATVITLNVRQNAEQAKAEGPHEITYSVSGTGNVDITYSTDTGKNVTQTVKAPWTKTVTHTGLINGWNVTARPAKGNDLKIGCSIKVDGKMSTVKMGPDSGGNYVCASTPESEIGTP